MDKETVWRILDMEPSKDEKILKDRYRQLLPAHNPEDDPEGFKQLREAYEEALRLINADDREDNDRPDDDIEHWLDKIRAIYPYPDKRSDTALWEEILEDDVCVGLDSFCETRERLLVFFMDHHYLPNSVWKLIDSVFAIKDDKKELLEKFPSNYIHYVLYQIETETFGDYTLFESSEYAEDTVDKYLLAYFELFGVFTKLSGDLEVTDSRDDLDDEAKESERSRIRNEFKTLEKRLDTLVSYRAWHPYEEVLRIRIKMALKDTSYDTAELLEKYPDELLILRICGEYLSMQDRWEEARTLWDKVLKAEPDNISALMDMATYLHHIGEYDAAENMIRDNCGGAGGGPHLRNFFIKLQEDKYEALSKKLAADPADMETYMECCWSLFHSNRFDKAKEMLEKYSFEESDPSYYDHVDMLGRIYLEDGDYEKSLEYLKKWEKALATLPDDGSDKYAKRKKTLGYQRFVIGQCYYELGKQRNDPSLFSESEKYIKGAIDVEEDMSMLFVYKDQLMQLYTAAGRYEDCIDLCDLMLEEDPGYIPAYLRRQEAYYHTGNEQGIVDDYYSIISEIRNYYRAYLLALRVLIDHEQWDAAKAVLDTARENLVHHPTLDIQEIRLMRGMYDSSHLNEMAAKCRELIAYLEANPEPGFADDEDRITLDDAWYQLFCVYAECEDFKTAFKLIKERKAAGCRHIPTYRLEANLLRLDKRYNEAEKAYKALIPMGADEFEVQYYLMLCYRAKDDFSHMIAAYRRAVELDPEADRPVFELALYYKEQFKNFEKTESFDRSLELFNRLVEMTGHPRYLAERSYLLKLRARYAEAIADLEEALRKDPECRYSYDSCWYDIGDLYFLTGNTEKALEAFAKSRELFDIGQYGSVLQPADVYGGEGNWEKALEWLSSFSGRLMDQNPFAYKYANIHLSCGHPEKAAEIYAQLLKEGRIDRSEYLSLLLKKTMVCSPADFDDAFASCWKEISKEAGCYDINSFACSFCHGFPKIDKITEKAMKAYINMGCELLFARKLKRSISFFKRAAALLNILKDNASFESSYVWNAIELYRHLALALKLAGKHAPAKRAAAKCLSLLIQKKAPSTAVGEFTYGKRSVEYYINSFEGKNPYRLKLLAGLYMCMGEYEKAAALLDRAEASPLCIDCQHLQCYDSLISRAYLAEIAGDRTAAHDYFQKALKICPSDRENSMGEYFNREDNK